MAKRGFASETTVHESYDGKTRIKQFLRVKATVATSNNNAANSKRRVSLRPSLIAGFPGTGLVGSISANFIIERADMHQIASVDSEFILPTVTYIGDKLRHPFRIYADEKGSLYVIVCEAPLMPDGIHSIMDLVVSWAINNGISEVITLDGIPVNGWPAKNRESIVLTSHSDNQRQQQSSLPSAPASSGDDNNNDDDNNELKSSLSPSYHHKKTTLITGMSAGLLSSCLSRDMACSAVLVPTASGVPDPEGAALLLQTISEMPNIPLELDVNPLLKEGKEIKRRLAETIASLRQQEEAQTTPYPAGRSMMYG
jgi:uncharacterized protein